MKKVFIVLILLLARFFQVSGQQPVQIGSIASDCIGAIEITDTVIGPVFSPPGYGDKLEISGNALGDPMYIEREHNTVWYKFTVPYDAIFTFDLVPVRPDDDFDFMLFKYDGPNFCQEILDKQEIPVRSNISRKNIEVRGMTGLREGEINDYVPSGPGSSYSRPLKVKKGEVYYLLVDNPFRENKGHTIYLHYKKLDSSKPEEDQEPSKSYQIPMTNLRVNVTDQATGDPIGANISIDGVMIGQSVDYVKVSQITLEVMSYKTYTVNCNLKGYLLAGKKVTPGTDSLYTVNIQMQKLKPGMTVNLDDIKFERDNTTILKESEGSLKQLYRFLQQNPDVKVEIQGNVNGPHKRNKKEYKELSSARAKAVYDDMISRGIPKDQMSYKGYGNTQMLFPDPLNKGQEEANRRVEIKILSL